MIAESRVLGSAMRKSRSLTHMGRPTPMYIGVGDTILLNN